MSEAGWESAQKLLLGAEFQKQPIEVAKAFTAQAMP
jgi:hypothetical protein